MMKTRDFVACGLKNITCATWLILTLVFSACTSTPEKASSVPHYMADMPVQPPKKLKPVARFDSPEIDESSGIVKSQRYADVYWTHNDSGDVARIFPIRLDGSDVGPSAGQGILVDGAVNRDWEDIASDHAGNLLIGAFGNNANRRRDLAVYVVPEPDPYANRPAQVSQRVPFHFPEQTAFPQQDNNYDVEALFVANGTWHILTKHRADTETRLYRFSGYSQTESNPLTLLASFSSRGMVTAADALADGSRVAVLTYGSLWVFQPPQNDDGSYDVDRMFAGDIFWQPIRAKQCEAVCFIDPDSVLITNEQGALFMVSLMKGLTMHPTGLVR
ncbi:MAG: hypothetical protein AAGF10_07340 [Verrucomicrobiota bacterium]